MGKYLTPLSMAIPNYNVVIMNTNSFFYFYFTITEIMY